MGEWTSVESSAVGICHVKTDIFLNSINNYQHRLSPPKVSFTYCDRREYETVVFVSDPNRLQVKSEVMLTWVIFNLGLHLQFWLIYLNKLVDSLLVLLVATHDGQLHMEMKKRGDSDIRTYAAL